MIVSPPAEIGMRLAEVDTPALLIDLDAFERNLTRLAERAKEMGVRLRPHAKTHKSPVIARRQMALGAIGVCCQKVSEAEAMVQGGVSDVLVSNEIAGARKCARLAALAREARIAVCVDDPVHIAALSEAATEYGVPLDVLVEINVGGNRCGVEPGAPALALAEGIAKAMPSAAMPPPAPSPRRARRATCSPGTAMTAPISRAPAPGPMSSRAAAASITSCRSAPMSSWTRITRAISMPPASRSAISSTASSSMPR